MPGLKRLLPPTLVLLLAIVIGASTGKIFTDSDTGHYLALAAGTAVPEPFAARQLAPLLVRALTHLGLSLHQGFWLLGVCSLAFFLSAVSSLLNNPGAPPSATASSSLRVGSTPPAWLQTAILGLFFFPLTFSGMVLPDLFYAALLSAFLLLIRARHLTWACTMLLPLTLARESSILVLLCWLYVAWRTLTWSKRLYSVTAVAAGSLIVQQLSQSSTGNREGLSPLLYLLGKVPWNFARNFLGVEPWANLNPACGVPLWHTTVHLGPLHDIGYCRLTPEYPIRLVAYALATFGLLPLLLFWVRKIPAQGLLVRFCLVYGVLSFLMAPLLGYSVQRLYGYGWPAFVVALPLLLTNAGFRTPRWAAAFVTVHLLSSWMEWRVDKLPLLLAELVLWTIGLAILQKGWQCEPILKKTPENAIIER